MIHILCLNVTQPSQECSSSRPFLPVEARFTRELQHVARPRDGARRMRIKRTHASSVLSLRASLLLRFSFSLFPRPTPSLPRFICYFSSDQLWRVSRLVSRNSRRTRSEYVLSLVRRACSAYVAWHTRVETVVLRDKSAIPLSSSTSAPRAQCRTSEMKRTTFTAVVLLVGEFSALIFYSSSSLS